MCAGFAMTFVASMMFVFIWWKARWKFTENLKYEKKRIFMLIPSTRHSSCFAKICLISLLAMRENISWCWIIFSLLLRSNDDYGVLKWCNWIFFTHSKTTFSMLQRTDCVHACSYHEYTKWIPEIIATSSRSYFIRRCCPLTFIFMQTPSRG